MLAANVDAATSKPIEETTHIEELKETGTPNPVASASKDHPQGDAIRTQVSTLRAHILSSILMSPRSSSTSPTRTLPPMRTFYSIAADAKICQSPSIASPDSRR